MRCCIRPSPGFTLLELMIVLAIMAAVATLSTPRVIQMYDSMQYRSAVRDLLGALHAARYQAIQQGRAVDLVIHVDTREYGLNGSLQRRLPANVHLDMLYAGELSERPGHATYRFYPDGSASGGHIHILRESGASARIGTTINIDWLLGRISQQSLQDG